MRHPSLVNLLELHSAGGALAAAEAGAGAGAPCWPGLVGAGVLSVGDLAALLATSPLRVEAGTQTVTHAVDRNVDVAYEWNEWALRRRVSRVAAREGGGGGCGGGSPATQGLSTHCRTAGAWLGEQLLLAGPRSGDLAG